MENGRPDEELNSLCDGQDRKSSSGELREVVVDPQDAKKVPLVDMNQPTNDRDCHIIKQSDDEKGSREDQTTPINKEVETGTLQQDDCENVDGLFGVTGEPVKDTGNFEKHNAEELSTEKGHDFQDMTGDGDLDNKKTLNEVKNQHEEIQTQMQTEPETMKPQEVVDTQEINADETDTNIPTDRQLEAGVVENSNEHLNTGTTQKTTGRAEAVSEVEGVVLPGQVMTEREESVVSGKSLTSQVRVLHEHTKLETSISFPFSGKGKVTLIIFICMSGFSTQRHIF